MEWNRKTTLLAGLVLACAPCLLAQTVEAPSEPQGPDQVESQQLIAWTRFQQPQPVPEPLPPPDKGIPQPDQQAQPPAQDNAPSAPQQSPGKSQTFTGKIVKQGDKFVLRVSAGTAYQLDEQGSASEYENKDVKVSGTLDSVSNTIHVTHIEVLS